MVTTLYLMSAQVVRREERTMATWVDMVLGSNTPYVTYAIPIFFILMAVEAIVGWVTNKQLYRLNDTINDLSCRILQQVLWIFIRTILFAG